MQSWYFKAGMETAAAYTSSTWNIIVCVCIRVPVRMHYLNMLCIAFYHQNITHMQLRFPNRIVSECEKVSVASAAQNRNRFHFEINQNPTPVSLFLLFFMG